MPRTAAREEPPVYVLTREASRELDRLALSEFGIPTLVLMENAARNAADIALDGLEGIASPRVIIVAGPGNNGGDGLAMARHLQNAGLKVAIILAAQPKQGSDAALHLNVCNRTGLPILDAAALGPDASLAAAARSLGGCDLVIDAMIGTGLTRPLDGTMAALANAINALAASGSGCDVLALDCPSGMDCETGEALGTVTVRASVTVTFAGLKPGFLTLAAQNLLGEVIVADIGVPRALLERLGTRIAGRPDSSPADPEATPPPSPPRGRARSRD